MLKMRPPIVGEFADEGGEELYKEVLYTILNMLGRDADRYVCEEETRGCIGLCP